MSWDLLMLSRGDASASVLKKLYHSMVIEYQLDVSNLVGKLFFFLFVQMLMILTYLRQPLDPVCLTLEHLPLNFIDKELLETKSISTVLSFNSFLPRLIFILSEFFQHFLR